MAPAGSYPCFCAAVCAGADAVYAGGPQFGARAYADNFTEEELVHAIEEAHIHGCRFYLTVNTLLKEEETHTLYDYLAPLYEAGLDAVIVQDIGVFRYIRETFPGMDLHASTQMTVTNAYGARFLERMGAVRVVPARELSLGEIKEIRNRTKLEIECFVHGALCYCYSGQCLMSSLIGGRSGNRGQCAQPCRLPYTANGSRGHFLSLKDICTLELIPELIKAGIDSFKIEGRMKSPEYVAGVTAMYRKYTDLYLENGDDGFRIEPQDREMLMDLYNRGGSSTGYYTRHNGKEMMALDRPNHRGVPAVRMTQQRGRKISGIALTALHPGDVLETAGGKNNYTLGQEIAKGEGLSFLVPGGMRFDSGTVFYRIRNEKLLKELDRMYVNGKKQEQISGFLELKISKPAVLTVCLGTVSYTARSEECVQPAKNQPLGEQELRTRLMKTGNSEFCFECLEILAPEEAFLPMRQINELKRKALEGLGKEAAARKHRELPARQFPAGPALPLLEKEGRPGKSHTPGISILTETREQLDAVLSFIDTHPGSRIERLYPDCCGGLFHNEKTAGKLQKLRERGIGIFPALPHIFRKEAAGLFERGYNAFRTFPMDGALIRNYESFQFLKEHGFDKPVILDHNLYVLNQSAKKFWQEQGVLEFTAPVELNCGELAGLGIRDAELVIYGYLPVMISAQCVKANCVGCTGDEQVTVLTDRYKKEFPVRNCCEFCYNIIYNSTPLYLGNRKQEAENLSPSRLRLQFSLESGAQAGKILKTVCDVFSGDGKGSTEPDFQFTQGHFKRGIL